MEKHKFIASIRISIVLLLTAPVLVWAAERAPMVIEDNTPISPDKRYPSTYAPSIEKASPSVVYIYTSKEVTRPDNYGMPFFDDPLFRRFFGDPREGLSPRSIPEKQRGLGSGVIVSRDGYILTNNHVVAEADEITVVSSLDNKEYDAEVIGTDPDTDIAVIKIEASDLPAITMTDSNQLKVGDVVFAIGNPFGVGQAVTMGIVSAQGRATGIVNYENFIQTDAAINPGNSGGALVDSEGRLVGINTAILSRSGGNQGIGFAVPVNLARIVMNSLVQHGKMVRGYLGVYIQPVTSELADQFKLPAARGALIAEVMPDTPAEEAGLAEGDVVIEVDGREIRDDAQFRVIIAQTLPESEVQLKIVRDGKEKEIGVTLSELTQDLAAQSGGRGPILNRDSNLLPGIQLQELDNLVRREFGIPLRLKGVLVANVDLGSHAAEEGVKVGDVILSVNRQPVESLADVKRVVSSESRGDWLLRIWSQGASRYVVIRAD